MALNLFALGKKNSPPPPNLTSDISHLSSTPTPRPKQSVQSNQSVQDIIAPSAIEVDFSHIKIDDVYIRTLFVTGYPRYVSANWLSPLINFNHSLDISMFVYPTDSKDTLEGLRHRIAEMEAEINTDIERGRIPQAATEAGLEDAKVLQSQLVKGAERFFQFSLYISISAESEKELNTTTAQVQSMLASLLIISKTSSLSMEEAFKTTLPYCKDKLLLTRNMDTTALSTTFPFTSSELSDNQGVLYGVNAHNESLVIFDRFSLENANMLILATSGAGKSFAVKLEILRSLMFDCQIIILDPENEYEMVTKSVGGNYLSFSTSSSHKINPFQIARPKESTEDEIGYKYLFLMSLLKIMIGEMNPIEEATLNRALVLTYRQKGITEDPSTHVLEPPRMEDLYRALIGMEEAVSKTLSARLERYVMGGVKGIFDQQSNIDINAPVTVFTLRDTADEIRPIVMFMILDFVWNQVRKDLRKRLLVVDEAWYLMRYEDSAKILQGFVKRARKYYFGVSIISQNVDDFLGSPYGKAIITNSALKLLLKQSSAAINQIAEVFYLSQGEKQLLLSAGVGEGIFFAGMNHVAIKIIASADEHALATSKPAEILERKKQADLQAAAEVASQTTTP
ncbi:MAG: Type IV secretory pathway VirB4 component-like protein [Candidatus Collierbacteria bacterium GW2011_GWB1_45_35]|uniref:Type IV secretory pathway VirB4 component-like protein n=1 Tax=Candidatus Collierbacteria bacterium GW2011_GWB2_45_17 TaxID=1618388 RepID=A0A837IQ98_9BACT|nr:MAG: Type IV secretory pathway VirB4 component-like protein [Microgenomates group bacterium GW2011_GWC1_44_23]KKT96058.1 MAG: Type IV secretory pathway VirB4 component-like protein [Candidatus Collierbacteria bacterium GW2011_GWA1_45_15]KKU01068.1 MAG: Type IV secretory pathway VirB4 component-like protein [Candidatus Collierbacteria bacterium GW2011_GWB2_45_17]KKU05678.1 MAG: Type IV secretory pathway VirB4 component-like protein [Candidatus Collierbacteria bacterium GW2011_GWB1_45_35]KKU07